MVKVNLVGYLTPHPSEIYFIILRSVLRSHKLSFILGLSNLIYILFCFYFHERYLSRHSIWYSNLSETEKFHPLEIFSGLHKPILISVNV